MLLIRVENINFSYGKNKILEDISFKAKEGEVTAIIGSNGTGKSTLLKNICGMLKGSGEVYIDDLKVNKHNRKEVTSKISYLSQFNIIDAEINVFEVILLGRIENLGMKVPDTEIEKVWKILKFLNIENLAKRKINQLSGGQKQMVFIGQALAREPEVLILDEPTNNLDLRYKFKMLDLIKSLTKRNNFTTVMVIHDLNILQKFVDRILVLHNKKVYRYGYPSDIMTREMFKDVYKMNVDFYNVKEGFNVMVPISPNE